MAPTDSQVRDWTATPHVWRVGHKVPINVYDGDNPVCQCQTAQYAKLIVEAVNLLLEQRAILQMRGPV